MGKIHSFETLGALDGPGIRTVVFLSGCPMRCKYCHNADTFDAGAGTEMTAKEVAEKVMRYKSYFFGGGGVTLSGGEPLFQTDFCVQLLKAFKKRKIHTALDTAGSIYAEEALRLSDLVILDIKHTDANEFFRLTGYPMENTLKTLDFVKRNKIPFWVRQVFIKGITDSEDNLKALKKMSEGAQKIELKPYHTMGVYKWEKLGIPYALQGVQAATEEELSQAYKILNGR